jgi:glycosyltransferase involved in cell wall biosynthesis
VVVTVHDASAHIGDRWSRYTPQAIMDVAFRRSDVTITHAHHVAASLRNRRLTDGDPHVIPLAFPRAAQPSGPPSGPPNVLFFGRIWPYKGLDHLLRAQPSISARVPDAQFVVAGRGEPIERYQRLVAHPDRVRFETGYVSVERREQLFREASVVVLPYIEASQTGVVPLACRHGKPVVATTVGGLPEVVRPGETGLLVPPGDPRALADAVTLLLLDDVTRAKMGVAARAFFETYFDLDAIAASTVAAYEDAIRRRGPDAATGRG